LSTLLVSTRNLRMFRVTTQTTLKRATSIDVRRYTGGSYIPLNEASSRRPKVRSLNETIAGMAHSPIVVQNNGRERVEKRKRNRCDTA
jgi:hypothetical protein